MKRPFRAIVSDLDGTLLNAEHTVGQFTIETFEKLAKQGIDIFIATGRNYPDVRHIIARIDVDQAMLITSNGSRANNLAGEVLLNHYLPEELALALMKVPYNAEKVCMNSYQADDWFIDQEVPEFKQFYKDSGYGYNVVDFAKHHGKQTEKVFFIAKDPADLLPIEQYVREHFGDSVYMTYSAVECLEIMAKGVCKAHTLEELVKMRGYTLQDCIAFGDGMNDVEMLSKAGKGCIMQNADSRLKAALPHNEVIGHHQDEAVAHYIRALFEIK